MKKVILDEDMKSKAMTPQAITPQSCMLAVLWRILAAVSRSLMDLLSVCHEGWWDNADDLGSTDTGTLSEDDILRLASLYATGAPSLVCSG